MPNLTPSVALDRFTSFGDLLKYLRRRADLTQRDLSVAVGYSGAQISRLEQNQRLPDLATIQARFIPALGLEHEPQIGARLVDLATELRREDVPTPGLPPFKGLHFFDEADSELFFGREALVAHLVERLLAGVESGERFLGVVGASGSGKSSAVRAGLVPALRWRPPSASWPIHILTPGAHPLKSLATQLTREIESVTAAATLADDLAREPRTLDLFLKRATDHQSASHTLLVVDQFEELFTLSRSPEERTALVDNLIVAANEPGGPSIVLIALRADFYAHCADFAGLRQALAQHQEYIGRMTAEELHRVIAEPAASGHWEFEPGLVELLLHDVGEEPGALPLLSHALLETWQRRRGRTMTIGGYLAAGGVRGAIAETAEAVLKDQLDPQQRAIARQIFMRLTGLGEGTQDTRRRAPLDELIRNPEARPSVEAVLTILVDARLVTTGEGTAEVAHEALIREWPTLRDWLAEDREGLRIHRHLTEAAGEWYALDRDLGVLFRGARLAQTVEWAGSRSGELNPLEMEFLEASQALVAREEAEREGRHQRELEAAKQLAEAEIRRAEAEVAAARRLRRRAVLLLSALVVAGGFAIAALIFGQQAARAGRLATSRELAAAALSQADVDPELSLLLALQSVSATYPLEGLVLGEAEDALHQALQASRVQLSLSHSRGPVNGVAFSPDGKRLATAGADRTAMVWDVATGRMLLTLAGHDDVVNSVAFAPDGARLATASADGTAKVWDAATGRLLLTFLDHAASIQSITFSPDGSRLATASADGKVIVWDAATGEVVFRLAGHTSAVHNVLFSPDGSRLATAGADGKVNLWDAGTGQLLRTYSGHLTTTSIAFSPDGKRLAIGEGLVRLWDVASGEGLMTNCCNTSGPVLSIAFSPDGTRLATASADVRMVRVWEVGTGEELVSPSGHLGLVRALTFSPDGARLATASDDGTAKVWKLPPSGELLTLVGHGGAVNAVAFSAAGTLLATAGADRTVVVWNARTGQRLITLTGHTAPVLDIAFSPDGTRLATASGDRTARIWGVASGKELLALVGHAGPVNSVAFSPDGARLATASDDETVSLWDAATGEKLMTLTGHSRSVEAVAFDSEGTRLATASTDGTAIVWDAGTGEVLLRLPVRSRTIQALAFSPDGTRLVTADTTVKVWDASSGEERLALSGHTEAVLGIAYSPDGLRIATASADGTAIVWDAATGRVRLTLTGHTQAVNSISFSPDGTLLATAGEDGTAQVYLLGIEELVALAESRLTRSLTAGECEKYLHVERCP